MIIKVKRISHAAPAAPAVPTGWLEIQPGGLKSYWLQISNGRSFFLVSDTENIKTVLRPGLHELLIESGKKINFHFFQYKITHFPVLSLRSSIKNYEKFQNHFFYRFHIKVHANAVSEQLLLVP